jgi:RNA polymerase sigma-70 factor (ECF subfamily)
MVRDSARDHRWEETDDVLHEALLRLLRALRAEPVTSAGQFFRLAATQVRRQLLDLARHYFGPLGPGAKHASNGMEGGPDETPHPVYERPASTDEPSRLLAWGEFHQKAADLPEDERAVFDLCWYQGLTQAEAALLLKVSETTVKRRWLAARARLGEFLSGQHTGP